MLLYYFDEGSGSTVHDRSKTATALDLTLPAEMNNARWAPGGQGVTLRGPNPLAINAPAQKLLAPAKTHACSIEFWLSADTIYYPYSLFAWEQSAEARNLELNHMQYLLLFSTHAQTAPPSDQSFPCLRSALQHYVITWDGTTTSVYHNGIVVAQRPIPWAVEQWQADYPFTLGGGFLGTFYLFAIHDRCLTPEQILRHYQAGPSAR